ncbi:pleckstrin homology domain-containing family G member 1, partial [Diaphorina citri]|uniref:Pleckstrin homology domain-containing family G member 1 n=1 Tax=Diaphorina citri TaxID=121845 RepID=A0A3Q0JJ71_DIACI
MVQNRDQFTSLPTSSNGQGTSKVEEDEEGEDLTTFGELCAEGAFRMSGAKALRHAFLFDKMLLITKKKEEGILGYKAHIMCSNLMLIESVPGEPLSFHVIPFDNPKYQYTLQARNLDQKREWCLQLKKVILENPEGTQCSSTQGYLERWRSSPDYPFTEQQLNDLFSNIQDIFHFNKWQSNPGLEHGTSTHYHRFRQ